MAIKIKVYGYLYLVKCNNYIISYIILVRDERYKTVKNSC